MMLIFFTLKNSKAEGAVFSYSAKFTRSCLADAFLAWDGYLFTSVTDRVIAAMLADDRIEVATEPHDDRAFRSAMATHEMRTSMKQRDTSLIIASSIKCVQHNNSLSNKKHFMFNIISIGTRIRILT